MARSRDLKLLIQQRQQASDDDEECPKCGEPISKARLGLGYACCLSCGEQAARKVKHTLVPVPKSNYIYAHTPADVLSPYSHKGNR